MIEEDHPASSFSWSTRPDSKTLTRNALNANKAHQYALTEYAKKLSAELEELETLLVRSLTLVQENGMNSVEADRCRFR